MLRSSKCSLSFGFPNRNSVWTSLLPHECHMVYLSPSSLFDHPNNICWGVQIIQLLCHVVFSTFLLPHPPLGPNTFLSTLHSNTFSHCFSLNVRDEFHIHTKQDKIIVLHIW
jgi:hypothetical protein